MAQLLKSLLLKNGDLSSDPQHSHKKIQPWSPVSAILLQWRQRPVVSWNSQDIQSTIDEYQVQ